MFGHAGAIVGNTIVYVDGAYKNPNGPSPKYAASSECWMGRLPSSKKGDVTKIRWAKLPAHPGNCALSYRSGCRTRTKEGGQNLLLRRY